MPRCRLRCSRATAPISKHGTPFLHEKVRGIDETRIFVQAWKAAEAAEYQLPCTTGGDFWTSEDQGDRGCAVKLCRPCLIRTVCLAAARARGERFGVWSKDLTAAGYGAKTKKAA
jgi:hypothetical protein